eukprot:1125151_1
MPPPSLDDGDKAIEQWKIKNLIKSLANARGNGTSMISLIIPPKDQIARVNKMLGDEFGTASNIKSRVNRLSVLGAITSTQQRLKLYNRVPPNGLVIYCGTVTTVEGKDKKLNIDFEPFKAINTSLYLCDNKFHTEPLKELLERFNVRLHHNRRKRLSVRYTFWEHSQRATQIQCRLAKEAWTRWTVRRAFRAHSHAKARALCSESCGERRGAIH